MHEEKYFVIITASLRKGHAKYYMPHNQISASLAEILIIIQKYVEVHIWHICKL